MKSILILISVVAISWAFFPHDPVRAVSLAVGLTILEALAVHRSKPPRDHSITGYLKEMQDLMKQSSGVTDAMRGHPAVPCFSFVDEEELSEEGKAMLEVGEKYNELIMAVESKLKGESRHETALRYIKQAEEPSGFSSVPIKDGQ